MANAIGLVNLHSDVSLGGLTERRPVASVSFLGRYGIIDFVLSNLSNSGIDTVGVLIKEKPRSLFKHIGGGNAWNFNSKTGGISLLYDEKYAGDDMYNHDINNLIENIAFLDKAKEEYVVVAPAHIITTLNYADVLEAHENSDADVTMVYAKIKDANENFIGGDALTIKDKTVTAIEKNKGNRKNRDVSLETYVMSKKTLLKLIKKATKTSVFYNLGDTLAYMADELKIAAYQFKGFVRDVNSYAAYFKTSMDFLDVDTYTSVFKTNWPIYTNTNDTPPAKYKKNASVNSSFVANGCIIDGTVENSILGRNVVVGKGAVVKDCILFSGSKVDAGKKLDYVILDKEARVKNVEELTGKADAPVYVKEGDVA